jgi:hypothetical protein
VRFCLERITLCPFSTRSLAFCCSFTVMRKLRIWFTTCCLEFLWTVQQLLLASFDIARPMGKQNSLGICFSVVVVCSVSESFCFQLQHRCRCAGGGNCSRFRVLERVRWYLHDFVAPLHGVCAVRCVSKGKASSQPHKPKILKSSSSSHKREIFKKKCCSFICQFGSQNNASATARSMSELAKLAAELICSTINDRPFPPGDVDPPLYKQRPRAVEKSEILFAEHDELLVKELMVIQPDGEIGTMREYRFGLKMLW